MSKLSFHYGAMNAGKSTALLQAAYNFRERGMDVLLLTAALDTRAGIGRIGSRIGLGADADMFNEADDLFLAIEQRARAAAVACVFVDEAQFLTAAQVWQLAHVCDELRIPVMCYGLRTDFQGQVFPGSAALLAIADVLRELTTICYCGRKATMVVRTGGRGEVATEGRQVEIGGNELYTSFCRRHWAEATRRWKAESADS